jgi:dimethylhistidine N-methyltransferase
MNPDPAPEFPQGVVRFYNFLPPGDPFRDEVLAGFSQPHKRIAPRYFFDERGAVLFAALCEQPEFYPVRSESSVLRENLAAIVQFIGTGSEYIEFRAGIGFQTAILAEPLSPLVYVPIDVDGGMLERASRELADLYPWLNVSGMRADFRQALVLPEFVGLPIRRKLIYLSGSLTGSFAPDEIVAVLRNARQLVGAGGVLLAGVDPGKRRKVLEATYNDAKGLNSRMHLNLLERVNRELGGDFQAGRFAYRAEYEATLGRVVMRLESLYAQFAHIAGKRFDFAPGETIETGAAWQYSTEEFQAMAQQAGFSPGTVWTDAAKQFSVHGMMAV